LCLLAVLLEKRLAGLKTKGFVEGAHFIKFRRWWEMKPFLNKKKRGNQIEAKLSKTLPSCSKRITRGMETM